MSCVCPDRSFGLVFRRKGLPEEQLEHSGRDVGDDFCYRHPGVSHLQLWYQDPGHAQSAEASQDPEAATVSGSPRDDETSRQSHLKLCYLSYYMILYKSDIQ